MIRRLLIATAPLLILAAIAASVLGPVRDHVRRSQMPAAGRFGISQDFLAVAASPAARAFSSEVLGPHGRVRVFIPYDARGAQSGGVCMSSPAYTRGAVAWRKAVTLLAQARADGLVAQVVFGQGTGIGVPPEPDPADPRQAGDYACGVRLALADLWSTRDAVGMPVDIEAWNEPDTDGYAYNWNQAQRRCRAPAVAPSCSGPWEAAMLWYEADTQALMLHHTIRGFPALSVAALTIATPQESDFLDADQLRLAARGGAPYDGYYQSLWRIVHCVKGFGGCSLRGAEPTAMPADWAVHDYTDPTAGGTADLTRFVQTLAQLNNRYAGGRGARIWITESGVQLDMRARADLNDPRGVRCAGAGGVAADTFGCRVDGDAAAQARGGRVWRALARVMTHTEHGAVSVSELFWYQFELPAEACTPRSPCRLGDGLERRTGSLPVLHAWDSALVDSTGTPRASFCALTGAPIADCRGRPDAYADAQWADWWMPKPATCPAHYGAWIADSAGSGVPSGEQCDYSPNPEPVALAAVDEPARGQRHG